MTTPFLTYFVLAVTIINGCGGSQDLTLPSDVVKSFSVRKCCLSDEFLDEFHHCQHINVTYSEPWHPLFYDEFGHIITKTPEHEVVVGVPDCGPKQLWYVYENDLTGDKLMLLSKGILRHYTHYDHLNEDLIHDATFYDYNLLNYCIDKAWLSSSGGREVPAAMLCIEPVPENWSAEILIKKIINPVLHVINICCLLAVAVIYFIVPPLRDLVGNILTTICSCLIVSQIADTVLIFTELTNHVSFIIADVIMYLSLVAAFFWLSSLGYYIWHTFRSRNVFLRVSDGRKYCYYSSCAWTSTLVMTLVALAAHFLFDQPNTSLPVTPNGQKTIGWLGIAVFFTPIACTVLIDIFFYLTTAQTISRMSTYGRIHGRMKFSFELFMQLFVIMSTNWLFLLLSWLQSDGVLYAYIIVNGLHGPLILLVCVLLRKKVRQLLKKTCCYGDTEPQWGEEMMSMTSC